MKKTDNRLKLSINYTKNLYKRMKPIKMKMKVYIIFLPSFWKKQTMNVFSVIKH